MAYLLQCCGVSEPLQVFYLEQSPGPAFAGFRPFQLDGLLACVQRADLIRQWQLRLRDEPADRLVVVGLGTQRDWEQRCETLLLS